MFTKTDYSKFVKPREHSWTETIEVFKPKKISLELIDGNGDTYLLALVDDYQIVHNEDEVVLKIFVK